MITNLPALRGQDPTPALRRFLPKRHPLEVTSDRLGDHYERYYDKLSGEELDAISMLRFAFEEIAEGGR